MITNLLRAVAAVSAGGALATAAVVAPHLQGRPHAVRLVSPVSLSQPDVIVRASRPAIARVRVPAPARRPALPFVAAPAPARRPATVPVHVPPPPPPVKPVVPSGTLGCAGLERLWEAAGGSAARAFMAAEIAMAESGGREYALSPTHDYGYWQINVSHGPAMATFNPLGNARAAISISRNGTDWYPWTTYTSGAYRGKC